MPANWRRLTALDPALQPLRARFNRQQQHWHVLALLSPT